MSPFFHFLQAQPFVALFGVLAAGMILGRPVIRGIALGSVVCIVLVSDVLTLALGLLGALIGVIRVPLFGISISFGAAVLMTGIGYPLPVAIATISLSIVGYVFALFA